MLIAHSALPELVLDRSSSSTSTALYPIPSTEAVIYYTRFVVNEVIFLPFFALAFPLPLLYFDFVVCLLLTFAFFLCTLCHLLIDATLAKSAILKVQQGMKTHYITSCTDTMSTHCSCAHNLGIHCTASVNGCAATPAPPVTPFFAGCPCLSLDQRRTGYPTK